MTRSRSTLAVLLFTAVASLAFASLAGAAPVWRIVSTHGPTEIPACGTSPGQVCGEYVILARNMAFDTSKTDPNVNATAGPYAVTDVLPPGVVAVAAHGQSSEGGSAWTCPGGFPTAVVHCSYSRTVYARSAGAGGGIGTPQAVALAHHGMAVALYIDVAVDPSVGETEANQVELAGGGATANATATDPTTFGSDPTTFGFSGFAADTFDAQFPAGLPTHQAGSHPFEARFDLDFNLKLTEGGLGTYTEPAGHIKDVVTTLPPGFLGNPRAAATCDSLGFGTVAVGALSPNCPAASQVGTITLLTNNLNELFGGNQPDATTDIPLYNLDPPRGYVADFGFFLSGSQIHILANVSPSGDSGDPYRITSTAPDTLELVPVRSAHVTLWGVPANPAHDLLRFHPSESGAAEDTYLNTPADHAEDPFLTLPAQCSQAVGTRFDVTEWLGGETASAETPPVTQTGCDALSFEPELLEARPTTPLADSPSGLDFHLHIPQNEDPEGLATPQLKNATVTLPEGLVVNPASANGLGACSMAQIGFEANGAPNGNPVSCPDDSKLGTLKAKTPVLEDPIEGSVYLARQNENPFGSLLALYLVLEDPRHGILVKLAGEATANPDSGQIATSFRNNPQLPVEDLEVHLFQGARAALRTPSRCGTHTATSDLTPWSTPDTPDATPSASFETSKGPDGGACLPSGGSAPNSPSFDAGVEDPTAAAYTPFGLRLARADGSQELRSIDTTLPEGLLAKLAGVGECSEAQLAAAASSSGLSEKANPSCPASSRVGTVDVGAGAGPSPLYVQGSAYLAGPYQGAPLSLAVLTPAVAGPFDLGTVLTRVALHVDPESGIVHAVSDPFPRLLQGIPLDVRSVALHLDRPRFTLNPTSCDPMAILGAATSVFGQAASLSSPFQVGECARLGFKPKLSLRLKGKTKRSGNPGLTATLTMPEGGANIASASVALPPSEQIENAHIQEPCTRVQFNAEACPAKSILGHARAFSPLLDQPLEGPVYFRSNGGEHLLPDLVADLRGQIEVVLVGHIDAVTHHGVTRIRNTFETVPDAPVSKFTLSLFGGKRGYLVNNRDICKSANKASVRFDAHNGKTRDFATALKVAKCPKAKKHGHHSHRRGR